MKAVVYSKRHETVLKVHEDVRRVSADGDGGGVHIDFHGEFETGVSYGTSERKMVEVLDDDVDPTFTEPPFTTAVAGGGGGDGGDGDG